MKKFSKPGGDCDGRFPQPEGFNVNSPGRSPVAWRSVCFQPRPELNQIAESSTIALVAYHVRQIGDLTDGFGGPPNPAVAFPKPALVNPGAGQPAPLPQTVFPPAQPLPPVILPQPVTPPASQEPVTTVIPRVGMVCYRPLGPGRST